MKIKHNTAPLALTSKYPTVQLCGITIRDTLRDVLSVCPLMVSSPPSLSSCSLCPFLCLPMASSIIHSSINLLLQLQTTINSISMLLCVCVCLSCMWPNHTLSHCSSAALLWITASSNKSTTKVTGSILSLSMWECAATGAFITVYCRTIMYCYELKIGFNGITRLECAKFSWSQVLTKQHDGGFCAEHNDSVSLPVTALISKNNI